MLGGKGCRHFATVSSGRPRCRGGVLPDKLGFGLDFNYDSFYAGVSRDGFAIIKCAPKTLSDRAHRKRNEHLYAHIKVSG